jgi:hypothetical protein
VWLEAAGLGHLDSLTVHHLCCLAVIVSQLYEPCKEGLFRSTDGCVDNNDQFALVSPGGSTYSPKCIPFD